MNFCNEVGALHHTQRQVVHLSDKRVPNKRSFCLYARVRK
jgi:hypothetical protein